MQFVGIDYPSELWRVVQPGMRQQMAYGMQYRPHQLTQVRMRHSHRTDYTVPVYEGTRAGVALSLLGTENMCLLSDGESLLA